MIVEMQVERYVSERRKAEVLINADSVPKTLATKAVDHIRANPMYGVWKDLCNLLKRWGSRPSSDIAKANRGVSIVPDSSAPIIETKAPTIRLQICAKPGDRLNTLAAATVSGAGEDASVSWSTTPTITKFVIR